MLWFLFSFYTLDYSSGEPEITMLSLILLIAIVLFISISTYLSIKKKRSKLAEPVNNH